MILRLGIKQLRFLREQARTAYPVETCAILFGDASRRESIVKRIVAVRNLLESATRFEIDPREFFNAFMQADKDGLEFLGLFHSHPAPAYPSVIDLKFMRLWGDAVWLILSISDNEFAAFQLKNGKVHELTLKIEAKFKE